MRSGEHTQAQPGINRHRESCRHCHLRSAAEGLVCWGTPNRADAALPRQRKADALRRLCLWPGFLHPRPRALMCRSFLDGTSCPLKIMRRTAKGEGQVEWPVNVDVQPVRSDVQREVRPSSRSILRAGIQKPSKGPRFWGRAQCVPLMVRVSRVCSAILFAYSSIQICGFGISSVRAQMAPATLDGLERSCKQGSVMWNSSTSATRRLTQHPWGDGSSHFFAIFGEHPHEAFAPPFYPAFPA